MKYKLCFFILCVSLLLVPAFATAADGAEARADFDALQRMQLRLRDLGYYTGSIDGINNADSIAAYRAFCENNGISPSDEPAELLYTEAAIPATHPHSGTDAPMEAPVTTGAVITWESAAKRLTAGETYTVTGCYDAIACELLCTGGVNHARMTPASDHDAKALKQLFNNLRDFSKQPVVIRFGGINAAASLQTYLMSDDAGDADTEYSLFFSGSVSDIGGLPDADHDNAIQIAAGLPVR